MAKTYASIHAQIERLRAEAESLRKKEVAGVIARIREAIEHYGITAEELGLSTRGRRAERGAPAKHGKSFATSQAKFADGQGNVWGGRGPRPAWLRDALAAGRQVEEFAVGGTSSRAPANAPVAVGGKRGSAKAPQARAPSAASKKAASSQVRRRAATKTALASTTREQAADAAAESSATE